MVVAAEEVDALPAVPEVGHARLVRVKAETEFAKDHSRLSLDHLDLSPGRGQYDGTTFGYGPAEDMQIGVDR
ncbi:MAG: hypothetical protein ACRD0Z_12960 [Acidimicrobiales bacterium]